MEPTEPSHASLVCVRNADDEFLEILGGSKGHAPLFPPVSAFREEKWKRKRSTVRKDDLYFNLVGPARW